MIVSGTVTSPAVQGVTVQDPADTSPSTGMGVTGANGKWVLDPGQSFVISALGTVTTAANLDWTQAGYFSLTLTGSDTCVVTFGTGSSTGALSASLGQMIKIRLTGASSAAVTWPSTITWVGLLTGTSGASASAPTVSAANVIDITLVCTATGSAPTYDGTYITG